MVGEQLLALEIYQLKCLDCGKYSNIGQINCNFKQRYKEHISLKTSQIKNLGQDIYST
jgi:hypothetical protein